MKDYNMERFSNFFFLLHFISSSTVLNKVKVVRQSLGILGVRIFVPFPVILVIACIFYFLFLHFFLRLRR